MIIKVKLLENNYLFKGSTLVILKSSNEPNSFFGGMAVPEWKSLNSFITDPAD